ncbi:MAG: tetratricopeptide repeat protein [Candidatus Eisenbacteria bacterium]|uniref:Tetratricopeptide repeat protein n=1 Tax=Eiseniibacteriota bacterium TaxID=2212470 RepID=A0A956RPV3_UNCEI|nr:tetratricopeptide repeat protein [Candidatus Eisenbacteria bacterium]
MKIPCRADRRSRYRAVGSLLAAWSLGLAGLIAGCAGSGGYVGDPLLRNGDLPGAIEAYRAELAGRPDDAGLHRNLGAALMRAGDNDDAISELETAQSLDPEDASTSYFLGRAADESGRSDLALERYTDYMSRGGDQSRWVRARIQQIAMERALADVQSALQRENQLSLDRVPVNTVAVPPFSNLSGDEKLAALSRGLSALLITDLTQVPELRVVEREKIQVLQKEIALGTPQTEAPQESPVDFQPIETVIGIQQRLQVLLVPGTGEAYYQGEADGTKRVSYLEAVKRFQADHQLTADGIAGPKTQSTLARAMEETAPTPEEPLALGHAMDPRTAARAGRILGARRFVQGSYVPIGDRQIQLDASILTVDSSEQSAGEPVSGDLHRVMRLEKDLLFSILTALGIEPDPATRRALEATATDNFLAFVAYGRGLLLEEEGRTSEALDAYREAVRNDPGFRMADLRVDALTATPADRDAADQAVLDRNTKVGKDPVDRLMLTGTWGGIGPGPAVDRDGDLYPTVTDADKVAGSGVIIVEGDLPDRGGAR